MSNYPLTFAEVNAEIQALNMAVSSQISRIKGRVKDLEAQASMQIPRIEQRLEILEKAQLLANLELIERIKKLEVCDREDANCWASVRQSMHRLRERIEALEQQPTCKEFLQVPPTPEAAPVATDEELCSTWNISGPHHSRRRRAIYDLGRQHAPAQPPAAQPARIVRGSDAVITAELEKMIELEKAAEAQPPSAPLPAHPNHEGGEYTDEEWAELKRWEQESPAPQPAPPPAPVGGLAERVDRAIVHAWADCGPKGEARAAIREVAAWLRENELFGDPAALTLEQEADR